MSAQTITDQLFTGADGISIVSFIRSDCAGNNVLEITDIDAGEVVALHLHPDEWIELGSALVAVGVKAKKSQTDLFAGAAL